MGEVNGSGLQYVGELEQKPWWPEWLKLMRAKHTQVGRWRAKADEPRAVAGILHNVVARDQFLEMADGYDGLANNLEDHEAKRRARVPT